MSRRALCHMAVRMRHAVLGTTLLIAALGCPADRQSAAARASGANVTASPPAIAAGRLSLGRDVSASQLARIDIDVNPDGVGLPAGGGTHAAGAAVYAARCANCHGVQGEGLAIYPRLISPEADTAFNFGDDVTHLKTVGNYWPYATTLYDYLHRAMPLNDPGSLSAGELYSLVAFLLAENRVISRTDTMTAVSLPKVRMPARAHFVPDNRTGGTTFR